jgi:carboxymethylenebutenolidase
MKESENSGSDTRFTAAQEALRQLWEEHVRYEFATHNTEDTLDRGSWSG